MDVNETLRRLREAVAQWTLANGTDAALHAADDAVQAFIDLDEWLSKGGFLPTEWNANRLPLKREV